MNVYISTTSFAQLSNKPLELLRNQNISFDVNDRGRKLTETELPSILAKYEGVIAGTEPYTKQVLESLLNLKVISRVGVGMDNIDLDFAKKRNIKVYKTKTTPTQAVAELTLGLILDVLRKISNQNHQLKNSIWKKQMGSILSGKTLGIIGLGTIGKKLVELTKGFELIYLANDIKQDAEFARQNNVEYCDLENLLKRSDIVSIHLNLSTDTHGLVDFQAIQKMKSEAILINTCRGEVINENSLVRALDEKVIAGAGLDVYCEEPYEGPLLNYDNVTTTPHIGSYAKEIRMQMELEAVKNLIRGFQNE